MSREDTESLSHEDSQAKNVIDLKKNFENLFTFVPESEEGVPEFFRYATNSTATIRGLKEIAFVPIDELEENMRPGLMSSMGFLGKKDHLLDVLASDNDFVLGRNLSHVDLARVLLMIEYAAHNKSITKFEFNSMQYTVSLSAERGGQHSPFDDGVISRSDVIVTNESTRQVLQFNNLQAVMIARYGFYQGDTLRRLPPESIIEMFNLAPS